MSCQDAVPLGRCGRQAGAGDGSEGLFFFVPTMVPAAHGLCQDSLLRSSLPWSRLRGRRRPFLGEPLGLTFIKGIR